MTKNNETLRWWNEFTAACRTVDPNATEDEIMAAGNWLRLDQFLNPKYNPQALKTPDLVQKLLDRGMCAYNPDIIRTYVSES